MIEYGNYRALGWKIVPFGGDVGAVGAYGDPGAGGGVVGYGAAVPWGK